MPPPFTYLEHTGRNGPYINSRPPPSPTESEFQPTRLEHTGRRCADHRSSSPAEIELLEQRKESRARGNRDRKLYRANMRKYMPLPQKLWDHFCCGCKQLVQRGRLFRKDWEEEREKKRAEGKMVNFDAGKGPAKSTSKQAELQRFDNAWKVEREKQQKQEQEQATRKAIEKAKKILREKQEAEEAKKMGLEPGLADLKEEEGDKGEVKRDTGCGGNANEYVLPRVDVPGGHSIFGPAGLLAPLELTGIIE
ncbi:MAG: hypothetical protein MMC33_001701 [Icmadophila ericetorum]|nr:hypothetical protein [Icmadophila ericetorum]